MTQDSVSADAPALSVIAEQLRQAVGDLIIDLRCATPQDADFLRELYASTRWEELAQTGWPNEGKRAFLDQQWGAQRHYYSKHYARADHLIIEHGQAGPIGRFVIHRGADLRLVDIALMPAWRGQGLGTGLVQALCGLADQLGQPIVAHVETFNPAQHLYARQGFRVEDNNQIYLRMRRAAAVLETTE